MNPIRIEKGVKGLIFDLDGTLVDTMPVHFKAWQKACSQFSFEFTSELFYELAGIPTAEIVRIINTRYSLNLDPETVEHLKESAYMQSLSTVKPIEPVMNLMIAGRDKYAMSIGTGGRKHVAMKTIELSGLDRYIDIIVTADDVTRHKPLPDTFLKCAELMGVAPAACQVFEDGDQGLEAGRAAGMIVTDIRKYI